MSVGIADPEFVDIDGDGLVDALIGNYEGNIVYFHNTGTSTIPSFTAGVAGGPARRNASTIDASINGGTTEISLDTLSLSTSIVAINDAPLASGTSALAPVTKNITSPPGDSVFNLFEKYFSDFNGNILAGIAITANEADSTIDGVWEFSQDNGSSWTNVPTTELSDTTALYLDKNVKLRFLPATNFSGTAGAITAHLIDDSTDARSNTSSIDISTNGGSTDISSATVSLVNTVQDAPVASGDPFLNDSIQNGTDRTGQTVRELFRESFSDVNENNISGVAITANAANQSTQGTWQYSIDNGKNWVDVGIRELSDSNALHLYTTARLRFIPKNGFNGTPGALTIRLIDNSSNIPAISSANPFGLDNSSRSPVPDFVDIDADGDFDIFMGAFYGGIRLVLNEGSPTNPSFSSTFENTFPNTRTGRNSTPNFADIDGDGDLDAFVGGIVGDIKFIKNDGTPKDADFTGKPKRNPFGINDFGDYSTIDLIDIDGDGDLDAFKGIDDGDILYYENIGSPTSPNFSNSTTNPFGLSNIGNNSAPKFIDIDDDNDFDVFIGNLEGNTVFFKNKRNNNKTRFLGRLHDESVQSRWGWIWRCSPGLHRHRP